MLLSLALIVNVIMIISLDFDLRFVVFVEILQMHFRAFDFIVADWRRTDFSNFTKPDFDHF